jgi:tetratricopeptide (TPR) repeat protein
VDKPTDFFISYTGKDRAWAEWIAWTLEEVGYKTFIQAWDFNAASNFVLKMQSGGTDTARTVAVLTPDYFKSAFTQPEWAAAFADDPKSENGKLIAIRVADFKPEGLFKAIVYIDLVGSDEAIAKEKLVKSVDGIVTGKRLKPDSKPVFPGAKSPTTRPPFPGKPTGSKPFLHNLPFAPNPFFTGREKMLQDLHAALCKKTAAAITQPQAVHGLGGVGKTQLAIEYAWQYQANYDTVLWVSASTSVDLHSNIASLVCVLNLLEVEATEQETKVLAVVNWLSLQQRWLLILDNVDSRETQTEVLKLLPPALHGNVLITSRLSDWPVSFADLEVSVLPEQVASEFLLKRARKAGFNPGNDADALTVAKELGCLPLALEQAAAYISRHRESLENYLCLLNESRARLLKFLSQGGTGYQQTVATTWLVSEQQLSILGRVILQLTSFLASQEIPRVIFKGAEDLLSTTAAELMNDSRSVSDLSFSKEAIDDALVELNDHSLIKLEPESISCHRLVQAVLFDRLDLTARDNWLDAATSLIAKAANESPPDPTAWPFWRRFQPQVKSVIKHAGDDRKSVAIPFLMMQLAIYYQEIGAYSEAESQMREAAKAKTALSEDKADVASYMISLANLLYRLAKYEEAESISKEVVQTCNTNPNVDNLTKVHAISVLAKILEQRDRFTEAEALYKQSIELIESDTKPSPIALSGTINNLANLMATTRRYAEAEPLLRKAVKILEDHEGVNTDSVATIIGNLARCLLEQGNLTKQQSYFDEAELLYRRALQIDEIAYGKDHPSYARDANNLGWLLHDIGKLDEAEALLRHALDIEERKKHRDHPDIATALSNLGRVLTAQRHFAEAIDVFGRAMQITEIALGRNHHEYATIQTNLAFAFMGLGELNKAEALFREALAIDEKCFGSTHVEIGQDLWNLGEFLVDRKRYIEAEGYLRRALKIFQVGYGDNHIRTRNISAMIEFIRAARTLESIFPKARKR